MVHCGRMPWVSAAAILAILGIIGAPFFNGSISKYLISHGSGNLIIDILLIVINLGTMTAFAKFIGVFRGKGTRSKTSKLRRVIILTLGAMCLLGGLFGSQVIEFLFGYSAKIDLGEYTVKALIFAGSVIASYFIYYKALKERKFLGKIKEMDVGLNTIAMSIVGFFAVLAGYLYIF